MLKQWIKKCILWSLYSHWQCILKCAYRERVRLPACLIGCDLWLALSHLVVVTFGVDRQIACFQTWCDCDCMMVSHLGDLEYFVCIWVIACDCNKTQNIPLTPFNLIIHSLINWTGQIYLFVYPTPPTLSKILINCCKAFEI